MAGVNDNVRYYSDARDEQRRVKVYMDGIDWQHELGAASDGVTVYPSPEAARVGERCLAEGGGCGIVEVEIRLLRWVEPQNLEAEVREDDKSG